MIGASNSWTMLGAIFTWTMLGASNTWTMLGAILTWTMLGASSPGEAAARTALWAPSPSLALWSGGKEQEQE